jgi:hypothetical protein
MSEVSPLSILVERAIHVVLEDRPPDWDALLGQLDAAIQTISAQISKDAEIAKQQAQQVPNEVKRQERAAQTLESMLHAATAKLVKAKTEYEKETQQRVAPQQRRPAAGSRNPTATRKKEE